MKSIKYYNSFWYRFTKPMKRLWFKLLLSFDVLIKIDDRHRGIGKTYMMIERSIKKDIPIVVGSNAEADHIRRHGNPVNVFVVRNTDHNDLHGRMFPNGVMIDESLPQKYIYFVKSYGIKIRGGFICSEKEKSSKKFYKDDFDG